MNLKKCLGHLNEEFFRGVFCKRGRVRVKTKDISNEVFDFLKSKGINNWTSFKNMKNLDKEIVDSIISRESDNEVQKEDVKFIIRYKLSTKRDLMRYLKELEKNEEYEKCQKVFNKIINKDDDNKKIR